MLGRQLAASAIVSLGENLSVQWQSSPTMTYAQIHYPPSTISKDLEASVIPHTLLTGLC